MITYLIKALIFLQSFYNGKIDGDGVWDGNGVPIVGFILYF